MNTNLVLMLTLIKNLRILIVFCYVAFPKATFGQTINLIEKDKVNTAIVIPNSSNNTTKNLAQELQSYFKKITNKVVPIIMQGQSFNGVKIFIGQKPEGKETINNQHPEYLSIINQDGNIYLYGKNATTTSFAVYTFIENQLGVRWFAPGPDWTFVPSLDNIRLNFKSYSIAPSISPRFWSGYGYNNDYKKWNTNNKITNTEETEPWRSFQNNIFRIFPPDKYSKSHPEYYALINNKRKIPSKDDQYWWPCIGNKDVQQQTIAYINNYFDKNPKAKSFSLGMDDIMTMCECDLCKAMDSSPSDSKNKKYSDRYYKFVNIVANEVKKKFPDRYIGTLIYLHTKSTPRNIKKLESNIFGYMTQDWAKWANNTTKISDKNDSKNWTNYMSHLSRYNYMGFNSIAPRFFPHSLAEGIKYDKGLNFDGMYSEIYTFLPHTAPMIWAFSKLQWDANMDIDNLLNEFYLKMFENSNEDMKTYYDYLETCWNTDKDGFNRDVNNNVLQQTLVMTSEDIDKALDILNRAQSKGNTAIVRKRIDIVKGGLMFYSFFVKEYALKKQIESIQLESNSAAETMTSLISQLADLSSERAKYWDEAYKRDDLLGQNLAGFKQNRSFENDINEIESAAINNYYSLIEWYNSQPNKLNQFVAQQSKLKPGTIKASLVSIYNSTSKLGISAKSQSNKLNSTLSLSSNTSLSTNLLKDKWTTWSRLNSSTFQINNAKTSKDKQYIINSSSSSSNVETGTILQNISNLKPGKKYIGTVWVKIDGKTENAHGISLIFRLRSGTSWLSNAGISSQVIKSTAGSKIGWQPLLVYISLPNNADGLSFMMSADNNKVTFKNPILFEAN